MPGAAQEPELFSRNGLEPSQRETNPRLGVCCFVQPVTCYCVVLVYLVLPRCYGRLPSTVPSTGAIITYTPPSNFAPGQRLSRCPDHRLVGSTIQLLVCTSRMRTTVFRTFLLDIRGHGAGARRIPRSETPTNYHIDRVPCTLRSLGRTPP